jgi:hypothetical protein
MTRSIGSRGDIDRIALRRLEQDCTLFSVP